MRMPRLKSPISSSLKKLLAEVSKTKSVGNSARKIAVVLFGLLSFGTAGLVGYAVGGNEATNGLELSRVALLNTKSKLTAERDLRRKIEVRDAAKAAQIRTLGLEKCLLNEKFQHQRKLVDAHIDGNKSRLTKAIRRNIGGGVVSWVPFVGDVADAGATVYDIREYSAMQREQQDLKAKLDKSLQRSQSKCR